MILGRAEHHIGDAKGENLVLLPKHKSRIIPWEN